MVVKTGPNRPVEPVEPGTGPLAGPEQPQNRGGRKPVKNRENRSKTGKPVKTAVWTVQGKKPFLREKTVFCGKKRFFEEKNCFFEEKNSFFEGKKT